MPLSVVSSAFEGEQQRIVAVLRLAVRAGRLSLEAYEQAVADTLRAPDRNVVADVVTRLPLVELANGSHRLMRSETRTRVASIRRRGRWQIAQEHSVATSVGSCWLDLTDAVFDSRVTDLEIVTGFGFVRVTVPPWLATEFREVSGKVVSAYGYEAPLPGLPIIRVSAHARGGAIRFRRTKGLRKQ